MYVANTQERKEMLTRPDPVQELLKQFPNCPRNVSRDNASVELKKAVAKISHDDPRIENLADQHAAHKIRSKRRNEIFAQLRALKARK